MFLRLTSLTLYFNNLFVFLHWVSFVLKVVFCCCLFMCILKKKTIRLIRVKIFVKQENEIFKGLKVHMIRVYCKNYIWKSVIFFSKEFKEIWESSWKEKHTSKSLGRYRFGIQLLPLSLYNYYSFICYTLLPSDYN